MKHQGSTKVITFLPVINMNVCMKSHGNPSTVETFNLKPNMSISWWLEEKWESPVSLGFILRGP